MAQSQGEQGKIKKIEIISALRNNVTNFISESYSARRADVEKVVVRVATRPLRRLPTLCLGPTEVRSRPPFFFSFFFFPDIRACLIPRDSLLPNGPPH